VFTEPPGGSMKLLATNGSRTERTILIMGYMALFPAFFFYHFLLGIGKIRAFLGGYFTPVSLLFMFPIVFYYVYEIKRDRQRLFRCDVYYGMFLAFFAAIVVANAASGANMVIVIAHIEGLLFMVNAFVLFKMIDFTRPEFRYPAMFSLLAMSAIIFSFSTDGMFRMDALGMAKDPAALSTYQGLARSYLVTFVCVIAYTRSLLLRVMLYAIGVVSLFLNTARSEFVAMLFIIPIIEFYFARQKLLFAIVLASLAALITSNLDLIQAQLPNNRILELLDLSQSNSAILRSHMMAHAVQTVLSYPIMGDYASYAPGHYAHNVFSAWVDLGLIGFVGLIAIVILPTLSLLITGYFTKRDYGDFILAFAMFCATILLLVKSHYFTDMLIGASIGAYSKYCYSRKYLRHRPAEMVAATPESSHVDAWVPNARSGP
jgi:hypothetical protein